MNSYFKESTQQLITKLHYSSLKLKQQMDESEDGSAFSFGSVQDTYYQNVKEDIQIGKLPYNPFLFDITLVLKKSAQGYEPPGKQFELDSTVVNVFGRKSKKKKQDQIQGSTQVKHEFMAQTMSKVHFSIDTNQHLKDHQSKKGTYIWLHRNDPKLLQVGDEFLLNQETIRVNSINKTSQKIQIQVSESKTLSLNPKQFKQRLFLIGSSARCHYVNKSLEPFHLGIDLLGLTLHNLIEDQDCSNVRGTWMKVKEPVKVLGGDLIMAYPYVFEVKY